MSDATPSPGAGGSLADATVRDLTARLSSSAPVPGGGSAAAIAGAMGASLVAMVAELTAGRPDYAAVDAEVRAIGAEAASLRERLLELAELDSAAFDGVMAARRLPKSSDEERARRKEAMGASFVTAAEVPLETARTATRVLELAARIAPVGNPNAISDAGVAAQLASAAVRGAALNVRINLPYLPADAAITRSAPEEVGRLESGAAAAERATLDDVTLRLG